MPGRARRLQIHAAWGDNVGGVQAIAQIEGYRQEHGINDPSKAFGRDAERGAERARKLAALRRLRKTQRQLGRVKETTVQRLSRSISIAR